MLSSICSLLTQFRSRAFNLALASAGDGSTAQDGYDGNDHQQLD